MLSKNGFDAEMHKLDLKTLREMSCQIISNLNSTHQEIDDKPEVLSSLLKIDEDLKNNGFKESSLITISIRYLVAQISNRIIERVIREKESQNELCSD